MATRPLDSAQPVTGVMSTAMMMMMRSISCIPPRAVSSESTILAMCDVAAGAACTRDCVTGW